MGQLRKKANISISYLSIKNCQFSFSAHVQALRDDVTRVESDETCSVICEILDDRSKLRYRSESFFRDLSWELNAGFSMF